jgi:hypothetical protein
MQTANNYKSLAGQPVRVHPQLTTDPAGKQGEYGIFISGDEDVVRVQFEDGGVHKYEPDALVYLFPQIVIERSLAAYRSELPVEDVKAICDILDIIKKKAYRQALEKAQQSSEMVQFCTTTQEPL